MDLADTDSVGTSDLGERDLFVPLLLVWFVNADNYIGASVTTTGRVQLVKRAGGTGSTLAFPTTGPTVAAGDRIHVLAKSEGSYGAYLNGVLVTQATDTQFLATGNRSGVGLANSTAAAPKTASWDNFTAWVPGELR